MMGQDAFLHPTCPTQQHFAKTVAIERLFPGRQLMASTQFQLIDNSWHDGLSIDFLPRTPETIL
jgi:hypothetical protein